MGEMPGSIFQVQSRTQGLVYFWCFTIWEIRRPVKKVPQHFKWSSSRPHHGQTNDEVHRENVHNSLEVFLDWSFQPIPWL